MPMRNQKQWEPSQEWKDFMDKNTPKDLLKHMGTRGVGSTGGYDGGEDYWMYGNPK